MQFDVVAMVSVEGEELATEGLVEDSVGEHLLRGAEGDHSAVQAEGEIEGLVGTGDIMRGNNDGLAGAGKRAEQVKEFFLARLVKPGRWFIEEEEVWVSDEGAGEEDAAALATAEFGRLAAGEVGSVHALERSSDQVARWRTETCQAPGGMVEAHADDLADGDGEVPRGVAGLGDVANRGAGGSRSLAEDGDTAGHGREKANESLQEGALAGAVGAEDCDEGACGDVERHILEYLDGAVPGAEVLNGQCGAGRGAGCLFERHVGDPALEIGDQ
jgi:hypothetical protein